MPRTPMPSSRATRAWPTSCTRSDTKKNSAPAMPATQ